MSASQITGDADECSSCESGWTKYLSSPRHCYGDDDSEVESVLGDDDSEGIKDRDRYGSDDESVISDASSGLKQSNDKAQPKHSESSDSDDDTDGRTKGERKACSVLVSPTRWEGGSKNASDAFSRGK